MPLASVVLQEARVLLNDTALAGGKLYTDTVLLPILRKAYRELQQELVDNGISTAKEATAALTVPANTIIIATGTTPPIPTDLLYPIMLHERFQGEADVNYVKMEEKAWPPDVTQTERLQFWTWAESEIKTPGATGITILRIRYWKDLAAIATAATDIPILDSTTFLAARTATIAAFTIGGAPSKSQSLQADAEGALVRLISTAVKNRQAMPVRRQPFRSFRRYGLFWR